MRLSAPDEQHLSYCTNIHPGESLGEVEAALEQHVLRVKAALSPSAPFGVGLRLSHAAARELARPGELPRLRRWLDEHGLYVFTINGFPYGAFHRARVKESVYEPDWRSDARVEYTNLLGDALTGLLPDGVTGSISTVPCAWKLAVNGPDDHARMAANILRSAGHLARLAADSGKTIALALEPEPGCVLETLAETVELWRDHFSDERTLRGFAEQAGGGASHAVERLQRHLGICLDTCHAAVEYEDLASGRAALEAAGIEVKKLQLSSGLRVSRLDPASHTALAAFAEDVYLHQAVAERAGELQRFVDLPPALAAASADAFPREWRVHFHVPIFLERYGALESTQGFLREVLRMHAARPFCSHLEVETYTWDVLPPELRSGPVTDAITRELRFVLSELGEQAVR
jgi:sugar phosphate isomerase/epimerase